MPLSREQLVASLTHEDKFVRSQIFLILSHLPRDAGEAFQSASKAIDQFGWNEAFEHPQQLVQYNASSEGLDWVLAELDQSSTKQLSIHEKSTLFGVIAQAPPEWLEERRTELTHQANSQLKDNSHGSPKAFVESLTRRITYSHRSPEECFAELKTYCAGLNHNSSMSDLDSNLIEALTDRIADKTPTSVTDELVARLSKAPPKEIRPDDWFMGALIILAGKTRTEAAITGLLQQFAADWYWWNEEIPRALGGIGSDNTIEHVTAEYFNLPEQGRLFVSSSLQFFRSPAITRRVIPLLAKEEDAMNRINLGTALAVQFDPEAALAAKAIYDENPWNPDREYLECLLYAHAQLDDPGFNADEVQQWRRRIQKEFDRIKQKRENLDKMESATLTKGATATRESPKVGRNDPCPCGSGKKFKKCCLN